MSHDTAPDAPELPKRSAIGHLCFDGSGCPIPFVVYGGDPWHEVARLHPDMRLEITDLAYAYAHPDEALEWLTEAGRVREKTLASAHAIIDAERAAEEARRWAEEERLRRALEEALATEAARIEAERLAAEEAERAQAAEAEAERQRLEAEAIEHARIAAELAAVEAAEAAERARIAEEAERIAIERDMGAAFDVGGEAPETEDPIGFEPTVPVETDGIPEPLPDEDDSDDFDRDLFLGLTHEDDADPPLDE